MSIFSGSNPLLTTITAAGVTPPAGYQIERSLRFNSSDSAYLSRTPASAGNRKTWTWAGWVKKSDLGGQPGLFGCQVGVGNPRDSFQFDSDQLSYDANTTGSAWNVAVKTTQVFRDASAWYHIVLAVDTTQATAANRVRIYVNGSEVTSFATATYPAQNTDLPINQAQIHYLAATTGSNYFNGYLADIHFIDGQALDPTSFTEVDATTRQLVPIEYTGTYGTNGFHLPFSDNSTAAALGTDTSGNGNDWTVNNISVQTGIRQNYWGSNTTTPGTPYTAAGPADALNGEASASVYAAITGTWAMNWGSLPTPISPSSTFRVYLYPRLGNITITINGTSTYGPYSGDSKRWESLGFTGTINTISITGTDSLYWGISAFESDGSILTDPIAEGVIDSLVDTPTNYGTDTGAGGEVRGNYATLNPLSYANAAPTNGNLTYSNTGTSSYTGSRSTFGISSGKWYWEQTIDAISTTNGGYVQVNGGVVTSSYNLASGTGSAGYWGFQNANGAGSNSWKFDNGAGTNTYTLINFSDIVGLALDMDSGTLSVYRNNTLLFTCSNSLLGNTVFPINLVYAASGYTASSSINFGQRPFAYTAPSGFKALCTQNLDNPVVAKPNTVMDVALYTGNGSTQTISGLGFSPDLVWVKSRSNVISHFLYDTVRGFSNGNAYELRSDSTIAEGIPGASNTGLTAFNSDGFSLGSDGGANTSSATYVGWTWDAGSSTVSNTDGSITSSVRANQTAGFSIVTYTGTGSNATVGHGLGVAPELVFIKDKSGSGGYGWRVYHKNLTSGYVLYLNNTNAQTSEPTAYTSAPTSSVLNLGTSGGVNSTESFVAYCFAPVAGYSSFGSYTGNGSTDGPFVYTGFRPRWILLKRSSGTSNWLVYDSARDTYNITRQILYPNNSDAEATAGNSLLDILSNGFKIRDTGAGELNTSASTYVWAAFAESPFRYARAR